VIALVVGCGLLGLLIGSFLNVVVWRVPRGESVVRPPSACPSCGTQIRSRDNVPVLSWVLLRGKCRDCGNPISARYPLVEAGTAVLFAVMAARVGWSPELPAYLYFAALGMALALIDIDTKTLPNVLVRPSWVIAPALLAAAAWADGDWDPLLRAGIGAAAFGAFVFVVWFLKPGAMGYGDVRLSPTLGAYLGWVSYGALAVGAFLGFLYGAVVGVALMAAGKAGRKSKVPFGPFLLAGALTGILVGEQLADLYVELTLG